MTHPRENVADGYSLSFNTWRQKAWQWWQSLRISGQKATKVERRDHLNPTKTGSLKLRLARSSTLESIVAESNTCITKSPLPSPHLQIQIPKLKHAPLLRSAWTQQEKRGETAAMALICQILHFSPAISPVN